jgi:hypothetical protein
VCYVLHPHKGISSQIRGDVVLVGKLPPPRLREFSWLMVLQRAWGVFVVTTRKTSCLPKCRLQIGSSMEQDRNVILVETCTSWWGKLEEKSDRSSDQKILPRVWHTSGWLLEV